MSDVPWVPQGWFGPPGAAVAAKQAVDALGDDVVGIVMPPRGAPPAAVDPDGEVVMFAVAVRPGELRPTPQGMREARPDIVQRLLGW